MRGFDISSAECGGVLNDPSGVITSPNYPEIYPHRSECTWVITAPEGNKVNLLLEVFHMNTKGICFYDILKIRYKINVAFRAF